MHRYNKIVAESKSGYFFSKASLRALLKKYALLLEANRRPEGAATQKNESKGGASRPCSTFFLRRRAEGTLCRYGEKASRRW